jgi:hypothetical protein
MIGVDCKICCNPLEYMCVGLFMIRIDMKSRWSSIRQVASANEVGRGQGLDFHIGNTPFNRCH